MKLIVKCAKCRHENKAPHYAKDRIVYAKKYGDNFSLTCESCNETKEYHVDDIKAVNYSYLEILKNRMIVCAIISVVTLILGLFVFGIVGSIATALISVMIFMVLAKGNNSSENITFNKFKLKGRASNIQFKK